MSSPRERLLTETIKNFLIGIQTSKEIYEESSKLEKKFARMNQREIDRCAKKVAAIVENYVIDFEKRNKRIPSSGSIKKKIAKELDTI